MLNTEYSSHYKQPTKFKFVNGLWTEVPVNSGATYNAMVSNLVCLLNVQQETDYNAEIEDNVGFQHCSLFPAGRSTDIPNY